MLDAFLEVVSGQTKKAEAFEELVQDFTNLPNEELMALAQGTSKLAYHDHDGDWLEKFEGTEFYNEALELEEECLNIDIAQKQQQLEDDARREEERANKPDSTDFYGQKDAISLKKRILDLNYTKSKLSGGAAPTEEEEELPEAMQPSDGAGEPNPLGELKEASVKDVAGEATKLAAAAGLGARRAPESEKTAGVSPEAIANMRKEAGITAAGLGGAAKKVLGRGKELLTGSKVKGMMAQNKGLVSGMKRGVAPTPAQMPALKSMVGEGLKVRATQVGAGGAALYGASKALGGSKKDKTASVVNRASQLLSGSKLKNLRNSADDAAQATRWGHTSHNYKTGKTVRSGALDPKGGQKARKAEELADTEQFNVRAARGVAGAGALGAAGAALKSKKKDSKKEAGVSLEAIENMRKQALAAAIGAGLKGLAGGAKAMGKAVMKGGQRRGAAGALQSAKGLGKHQIGQAAQWAGKNRGAAGAIGAGALGTAALGGAALSGD